MNYYGSKQLADAFRTVRKNTLTIANEIPEDKYSYKATPDVMSVRELLAHLAVSPMWHIDVHTQKLPHLDFAYFSQRAQHATLEEKALATKADVIKALTENGDRFATFVEGVDEATLASVVTFPQSPAGPSSRTRFEMLLSAKEHEMHHRAQLMLIQRLIGQVPELTRRRQATMAANR
ncbi:MAG TPA: DinB family protein [Vicinamibacterales bacterium]|nr:DinB family protein [Vicinamibacterales bacterium]